jgi:hypothetical protein
MHAKLILPHPEGEPPARVVLHDISMDGAGLFHCAALPVGMRLLLQLPDIHGTTLTIPAHVVGCSSLESDRHRIGLQFEPHDCGALDRLRNVLP